MTTSEQAEASDHGRQRETAFLIADAARRLNDTIEIALKPLGLTRAQWRILAYVSRTPGITQTALARETELGQMAITGVLTRMEHKELIERRVGAHDRRVREVHLTARSRRMVSTMNQRSIEALNTIFEGITEAEVSSLQGVLARVMWNCRRC